MSLSKRLRQSLSRYENSGKADKTTQPSSEIAQSSSSANSSAPQSPSPSKTHRLIPKKGSSKQQRKRRSDGPPLLTVPRGKSYSAEPIKRARRRPPTPPAATNSSSPPPQDPPAQDTPSLPDPPDDDNPLGAFSHNELDNDNPISQHRSKKLRQWENWMSVMPVLVEEYIQYMFLTKHLRNATPSPPPISCSCDEIPRTLLVRCVFFDKMEQVTIDSCTCNPAPVQLLRLGLFASSPVHPTLAVDLRMLDFLAELHTRTPPNQTAWCDTLEHVLRKRDYTLQTRDTLRKRFSSALQWYRLLEARVNQRLTPSPPSYSEERANAVHPGSPTSRSSLDQLNIAVAESGSSHSPSAPSHTAILVMTPLTSHPPSTPPAAPSAPATPSAPSNISHPSPSSPAALCASEFLRERCPLCFGGKHVDDVIVCADACFTQKRTRNSKFSVDEDPPRVHPRSLFLSRDYVHDVETYVANRRDAKSTNTTNSPDDIDPGMKLPNSILNECNDSFIAADERREKASTQFFIDTGLMALLCRHDRPLWLANMQHAGERQHYVIALIKRLFEDLPSTTRVRLLYDIGCQTHRSFEKFNYLPEYRSRLSFGVSVFHAFGHQWPCQLIYHPRKCVGFGLSDGEGSERLWHAISMLISVNRVSGHHQRIFNLDALFKHLDEKSIFSLGKWLERRWMHMLDLKSDADRDLEKCGVEVSELRKEWKAQVVEQTRPLERQSKDKVQKAIDRVIALDKTVETHNAEQEYLTGQILDPQCPDELLDQHNARLESIVSQLNTVRKQIDALQRQLGTADRVRLKELRNNKFLLALLNARALKQRIMAKLRQRKFELMQLERAFRRTVNDAKLSTHSEQAAKRREPGIAALVKKFNEACIELEKMLKAGKAPAGYTAPRQIRREGLFQLDVDDDVWEEVGVPDEEGGNEEANVPRWLGDEDVRVGIRAMLLRDRCGEEEARLIRERGVLQEWMVEEWSRVEFMLGALSGSPALRYHYELQREYLITLCAVWDQPLRCIPQPEGYTSTDWGPSRAEIIKCIHQEHGIGWALRPLGGKAEALGVDAGDSDADDDVEEFNESNPDIDTDLLDQLESITLTPPDADAIHPIHANATLFPDVTPPSPSATSLSNIYGSLPPATPEFSLSSRAKRKRLK